MSGAPRWNLKELTEFYRNRGEACPVQAACGDGSPVAHPKKTNQWAPYRSKTEAVYAENLALQVLCGAITKWEYEPEKWRLGHRCFLTVDFRVTLPDGSVEWHEVKPRKADGRFWAEPDAWIKLKTAAANSPEKSIFVVWPGDRRMTVWNKELVPSGAQTADRWWGGEPGTAPVCFIQHEKGVSK